VCGKECPATTEFFYKHRDSLHAKCKSCYNQYQSEKHSSLKYKEKRKERLANQRDHINARQRDYYSKNPDKWREYYQQRDLDNPEGALARVHKRRARIKGNGGAYSAKEWKDLCDLFGNKCLACGNTTLPLTVDHVIPLSKGGTNDITNLQPLCKPCNTNKRTSETDYRKLIKDNQ